MLQVLVQRWTLGPDNEAEVMGRKDVPIVRLQGTLMGTSAVAQSGFKPPLVAPPCCTYIKACSCGQLHQKYHRGVVALRALLGVHSPQL